MLTGMQGFPAPAPATPGAAFWGPFAGLSQSEFQPAGEPACTSGQPVCDMAGFPGLIGSRVPTIRPMTYNGTVLTTASWPYMRHIGRGVMIAVSPTTGSTALRFSGTQWSPFSVPTFTKRNILTNGLGWCMLTSEDSASAYETFDYGQTWASRTLPVGGYVYNQGRWNSTTIATLSYGSSQGNITRDGGRTWSSMTVNNTLNWRGIAGLPNGEAVIIAASTPSGGYSPDYGRTWVPHTFPTTPASSCYLETIGDAVYFNPMNTNGQYLYRWRGRGLPWEQCRFFGGSPWLTTGTLLPPQIVNGVLYSLDTASGVLWASTDGLTFAPTPAPLPIASWHNLNGAHAYGRLGANWVWLDF